MKITICSFFILLQVSYALSECLCTLSCPDEEPSADDIQYYIYQSFTSTPTIITYNELDSLSLEPDGRPTTYITHGFLQNVAADWIQSMVQALFINNPQQYVVVVNWAKISSLTNYYDVTNLIYPFTALKTCCTGDRVADFIVAFSSITATDPSLIHAIGHSLGAHMIGCAARKFQILTQTLIGHVTGLDAAGPMFQDVPPDCKLSQDDAQFVDAYHSNQNTFGYTGSLGHTDVLINNGFYQPCVSNPMLSCTTDINCNPLTCSHAVVTKIYTESINSNSFLATQCDSWTKYECGLCDAHLKIPAGYKISKNSLGKFYMDADSTSPYALNGKKICPTNSYTCPICSVQAPLMGIIFKGK